MTATLKRRQQNVTGRRIQEMRRDRGMSPEMLGNRVGVSGRTIRRIEEGKGATVRTMFLIAQEFDLKVHELWP